MSIRMSKSACYELVGPYDRCICSGERETLYPWWLRVRLVSPSVTQVLIYHQNSVAGVRCAALREQGSPLCLAVTHEFPQDPMFPVHVQQVYVHPMEHPQHRVHRHSFEHREWYSQIIYGCYILTRRVHLRGEYLSFHVHILPAPDTAPPSSCTALSWLTFVLSVLTLLGPACKSI